MSFKRKVKRVKERNKNKRKLNDNPMVWAVMTYRCKDCGAERLMYLENTLERHNGENHKPVPFGIRCPKCGGFHCYDDLLLFRELPKERPLRSHESYFKDDPKFDCGVPVYRG